MNSAAKQQERTPEPPNRPGDGSGEELPAGHGWFGARFRALRAFSFPLSALPVLLVWAGTSSQARRGTITAVCCLVGAVLLHASGNLFNDYFDHRYGVDRRVSADEGRPGRLLVNGCLRPRTYLRMALGAVLCAAIPAAYIWHSAGGVPVLFALVGLFLGYSYTGPPLRLKHRGLGEPVVFLAFGPLLMAGAAWALAGRCPPVVAWLSLPVGAATMAVLVADNLRDMEEDGQAGIRTLVMLLGRRWSRRLYVVLVLGSALGAGVLAALGVIPPVGLAAPLALVVACRPLRNVIAGRRMPNIDVLTAGYATALMLLLLLTFIFGRWL